MTLTPLTKSGLLRAISTTPSTSICSSEGGAPRLRSERRSGRNRLWFGFGKDVITEVLEVGGTGPARVGDCCNAGANAGHVGVVPVAPGVVHVGMNVHKSRGDNLAGNIQDFP